jgi:6-phosphogluconolactonase
MVNLTGTLVAADQEATAVSAAARIAEVLVEAQRRRGVASLVVTGGGIGTATLSALATAPGPDWSRVEVWWGDERFVAADHPDRNELQARAALLDRVPVEAALVHPVPARDVARDVTAAAAAYAEALYRAGSGGAVPEFDALMLGVGPDGHVASLFPGLATSVAVDAAAGAVTDAPKPPAERVSLTMPTLCAARTVWLLAAGAEKAAAVAAARTAGSRLPAALVRGRESTTWCLDRAAAGTSEVDT